MPSNSTSTQSRNSTRRFFKVSLSAPPHGESREIYQRLCYIPLPQNRKFTGRGEVLQRLQEKLFIQPDCQKLALLGLGGVGKTSVALQFAYWMKEHQPDYSVLWVSAYSRTGFDQAYMEIARRLGIKANNKDEDSRELVRRYLESEDNGKWFLVVDNVDDESFLHGQFSTDLSEVGIDQYLPASENCVLLFTTRSPDVAVEVADPDVVELEEMSSEEALGLLTKSLRRQQLLQDEKPVAELLEELAYLPLAIAQAAAYLNRNRHSSIISYLRLLHGTEEDMVSLLSREFRDGSLFQASQRAVATTWLVSFDQISVSDGAAMKLLSFISCIEPKNIPLSLLPQMETAEEREHAIGTLCGYAFLAGREDGEMFDMHRLVHVAAGIWNQRSNRVRGATLDALYQLDAMFPSSDTVNREQWRAYMPHTVRVLRESKEHYIQERYDLFYRVGQCFFQDRRFKEAVEALEETASWRRDQMSDMDPARLTSDHWLASAYLDDRRIKEAIVLFEHVVMVEEQTLDERDHSRLASQHELASAYLSDRRIKEAIVLLERVVMVEEQTLDERDHDRLASQHALARAYLDDRRIKDAIVLLEHVVAVEEQTLDERDHSRLTSQHELANAYLDDRRIKEAIVLLERVVAVREQTLDERDHSRLASQHELASAYLANGVAQKAVVLLEHVVAIESELLAHDDHSRLLSVDLLSEAREAV